MMDTLILTNSMGVFFLHFLHKRHWQNHQNRAPPSGRRWL